MKEIVDRVWDVIVIGTGIGGGTAGRALAEAGRSVLFLEKGRQGFRAERQGLDPLMADPVARSVRGYWPEPVHARVNGRQRSFFAPLGSGAGGSSVFYAATLERPAPHDLDPGTTHPGGGWPVGYEAMRPWFDAAEAMYHVHGEPDPLSPTPCPRLGAPATASAGDAAIMERLRANGQHPYRLHTAIANKAGCLECLGVKCPRVCKMDGRSAGLEPALATGRAELLDECEVVALRGEPHRITHVEALHRGERLALRARQFVLAAGALSSPRLLQASRSEAWPQGCANEHGQVGRHLMFHVNELFAIWPPGQARSSQPSKAVGLRDLYTLDGRPMGMVQAMGVDVSYGLIAHFLRQRLDESRLRPLSRLAPLAASVAALALGQAKLFVGILEDLPCADNRVVFDPLHPTRISFEYTMRPELLERRALFRKAIQRAFRGMRPVFVDWRPELNYGHACGTLRAGTDPTRSVVNAEGRAHTLDNLFVADASFFPTSTGVNPSLTIAANALRVAHLMKAQA
jgi:choline dehydrogenase-like flavoprotein